MQQFGVYSEVGKLRKVIVHRPDLSMKRLTPTNHDDLLFDDVLWVERAQYEHDQFVKAMRDAYLRAGPDFQLAKMTPRPLDLGPIATLTNFRLPYKIWALIWIAAALLLIALFIKTHPFTR